MNRRALLALAAIGVAGTGAYFGNGFLPMRQGDPGKTLSASQWLILSSVLEHLLPSEEDSPGAQEVNAIGYLDAALMHADQGDQLDIKNGCVVIEALAYEQVGCDFAQLSHSQRETVLRSVERSMEGDRWLTLLLTYSMEALLGDPAHGGNRGESGWRWLQLKPGTPRIESSQLAAV